MMSKRYAGLANHSLACPNRLSPRPQPTPASPVAFWQLPCRESIGPSRTGLRTNATTGR